MALKLTTRMPYGNACATRIRTNGDEVEVQFSPSPCGFAERLWFYFRLFESTPDTPQGTRIKLILKHADTLSEIDEPSALVPVYHKDGQGWSRMKHGVIEREPDGQRRVVWNLRYPEPSVEVALCYPYGMPEIKNLVSKAKGYWKLDSIGISGGGREIVRLSNLYQATSDNHPGLYIVARRHAGETPGSWVLDGLLRHLSVSGKTPLMVWAQPLADIDGVLRGHYRASAVDPSRPELRILDTDVQRWKERCRPLLILELSASAVSVRDGVHSCLPAESDTDPDLRKEAERWANMFKTALTPTYVSSEFMRESCEPFAFSHYGVCSLSIHIPYSQIGSTELTPKDYRQLGKRLADAVIRRQGKS